MKHFSLRILPRRCLTHPHRTPTSPSRFLEGSRRFWKVPESSGRLLFRDSISNDTQSVLPPNFIVSYVGFILSVTAIIFTQIITGALKTINWSSWWRWSTITTLSAVKVSFLLFRYILFNLFICHIGSWLKYTVQLSRMNEPRFR